MRAEGVLHGRERDIARISALLAAGETLVTIWGPAGVGKTRLAEEVLARAASAGVFVDLRGATDLEGIVTRMARALGVPAPGDSPEALGGAVAHAGPTLFVLDNAEQVRESAASAVRAWRSAAPQARFVTTSREPLGVRGEKVVELGVLDVDAAVAFLVERAGALGFVPKDTDGTTLAAVALAVDALPLALELAAPRLALLGAEVLRERLARDGAAAGGAPRSAARSTLDDAIDASWRLLDDAEKRALAAASVFRGDFDADAAQAVLAVSRPADDANGQAGRAAVSEPDALDLLQALHTKALVTVDQRAARPRFRLLVSVRDFAARRALELDVLAGSRRRHARHFAGLAQTWARALSGSGALGARRGMRAERDELFAAVAYGDARDAWRVAVALQPLIGADGPSDAYLRALDTLAERAPPDESVDALACVVARADARRHAGDLDEARALSEQARARAAAAAHRSIEARAEVSLGFVDIVQGRLREALGHAERALASAREMRDEVLVVQALWLRANVLLALGEHEGAATASDEALSATSRLRWRTMEARVATFLSSVRIDEGRIADARLLVERARRAAEPFDDRALTLNIVGASAMIAQRAGAVELAAREQERALELARILGAVRTAGVYEGYVGLALSETDDPARAAPRLRAAIDAARATGDRRYEALFEALLAGVEAATGDIDLARGRVARTAELMRDLADPGFAAAILYQHATVHLHEAARAAREGDRARAADARRAARDEAKRAAEASRDPATGRVRYFAASVSSRIYERACGLARTADAAPPNVLAVGPEASWLRAPDGEPEDLTRRPLLRALLRALLAARQRGPDERLSRDALLHAGWGAEKMRAHAAGNRLRVALASLRDLGLRAALNHDGRGWWLDPRVPIFLADAADT